MVAGVGGLLEPNAIQQLLTTGEFQGSIMSSDLLLIFGILLWVPFVMAFLSVTLKNPINRWANIIVGAVFAVFFIGVIASVAKLSGEMLMTFSTVVALSLIVWYAWKSKQKV